MGSYIKLCNDLRSVAYMSVLSVIRSFVRLIFRKRSQKPLKGNQIKKVMIINFFFFFLILKNKKVYKNGNFLTTR